MLENRFSSWGRRVHGAGYGVGWAVACMLAAMLTGCADPATTDFISLVESAKQKEYATGSRVRDFYRVTYDITRPTEETAPHTAEVTVKNLNETATWKLAYEYRGGKWKFLREKSRRFRSGDPEGAELTDDDGVWKHFVTQELN